jgi:3-dehydroquinate synthase
MLHYPDPEHIWPGSEAFLRLNHLLAEQRYSKVIFLTDENTHQHCLPLLLPELEELGEHEVLEVPAGEESKSPEVLTQLWYALSELGADRHALMINIGGGMITDLGGMLAGTYLRGIDFVNIPTSLLAMVDASIGGKTGINLGHEKNRVGLFLEPRATCIIYGFLETLPLRERRSGFAEMLKHGLISDMGYWERCLKVDIDHELPDSVLILESVKLKKRVVDEDFRESGYRKILNFGHNIGHAIESLSLNSANPLLHGEAVILGMMAELELSAKCARLDPMESKVLIEKLSRRYPDLQCEFDTNELIPLIRRDKKNEASQHHFTLLDQPGRARPDVIVPEEEIIRAIQNIRTHSSKV